MGGFWTRQEGGIAHNICDARMMLRSLFLLCAIVKLGGQPTTRPTPQPSLLSTQSEFTYTGDNQWYRVPAGVSQLRVKVWGAGGGGSLRNAEYSYGGGAGGYTECFLEVTPGEVLQVVVGGGGTVFGSANAIFTNSSASSPNQLDFVYNVRGGFAGGGNSTSIFRPESGSSTLRSKILVSSRKFGFYGSGGGRSAIRRSNTELITAGGGGGGGSAIGDGTTTYPSHTLASLLACRGGGGAGGGSVGLAIDNKGCQTTSTGGSTVGPGVSACGGGSQFLGGSSAYDMSETRFGPGGGGGYYGGAPGCKLLLASKLIEQPMPSSLKKRWYVTGGTGGSGFTGGCQSGLPIVSLSAAAGVSYGQPLKFALPPRATERNYMAGAAVGGQPVQNTGDVAANGGDGFVLIDVVGAPYPSSKPTMQPTRLQNKAKEPTQLPTVDSKTVYKFPRAQMSDKDKTMVVAPTLPEGALHPIEVRVSGSQNMLNASALFDGVTSVDGSSSTWNFVDSVCKAAATPLCNSPFSAKPTSGASLNYPACLYSPQYGYVKSTQPWRTKVEKSKQYSDEVTFVSTNSTIKFPRGSYGFESSGTGTIPFSSYWYGYSSSRYDPRTGMHIGNAWLADRSANNNAPKNPYHSDLARWRKGEYAVFKNRDTTGLTESIAVDYLKIVAMLPTEYPSKSRPTKFSLLGTSADTISPWDMIADFSTSEISYVTDTASPYNGRPVFRSPPLNMTKAYSLFALVVHQIETVYGDVVSSFSATQNVNFKSLELYGRSLGQEDSTKAYVRSDYLGEYATVDLGEKMNLQYFKLFGPSAASSGKPAKFKIYGSNNGQNWDVVVDQSSQAIAYSNGVYTSPVLASVAGPYKYYSLVVGEVESGSTCLKLTEWELYGSLPEKDEPLPSPPASKTLLETAQRKGNSQNETFWIRTDVYETEACSGRVVQLAVIPSGMCEIIYASESEGASNLGVGSTLTKLDYNSVGKGISTTTLYFSDSNCKTRSSKAAVSSVRTPIGLCSSGSIRSLAASADVFTFPAQGLLVEEFSSASDCRNDTQALVRRTWTRPYVCMKNAPGAQGPTNLYSRYSNCATNSKRTGDWSISYYTDADCLNEVQLESTSYDASMTSKDACSYYSTTAGTNDAYLKHYLTPSCYSPSELPKTFSHTATTQSYIVPAGVTELTVKLWGAGGGAHVPFFNGGLASNGYANTNGYMDPNGFVDTGRSTGGAGGFVQCTIAVTPGETLEVVVGGGGNSLNTGLGTDATKMGTYSPGGYGGGGDGVNPVSGVNQGDPYRTDRKTTQCGGGGGRTAIQRNGQDIVTAGGGGGSCNWIRGGGGGGPRGGTPNLPDCNTANQCLTTECTASDCSSYCTTVYNPNFYTSESRFVVGDCAWHYGKDSAYYSARDKAPRTVVGPSANDPGSACDYADGHGSAEEGTLKGTWKGVTFRGGLGTKGQGGPVGDYSGTWNPLRQSMYGGGGGGGYWGGSSGCASGGTGGSSYTGGCIQSQPILSLQGEVGKNWLFNARKTEITSAMPPNTFDSDYPHGGVGTAPMLLDCVPTYSNPVCTTTSYIAGVYPAKAGDGAAVFTYSQQTLLPQRFPRVPTYFPKGIETTWTDRKGNAITRTVYNANKRRTPVDGGEAIGLQVVTNMPQTYYWDAYYGTNMLTPYAAFDRCVQRECFKGTGTVLLTGYYNGAYTGTMGSTSSPVASLTADDPYKGNIISIDFGESMTPAFFKLHCPFASFTASFTTTGTSSPSYLSGLNSATFSTIVEWLKLNLCVSVSGPTISAGTTVTGTWSNSYADISPSATGGSGVSLTFGICGNELSTGNAPTPNPSARPTLAPSNQGGSAVDLFNNRYAHCPGKFRLYGSNDELTMPATNTGGTNFEQTWDLLFDQTERADYQDCVFGSETSKPFGSHFNTSCYTSPTIRGVQAYSKLALVFSAAYGRSQVELSEIEYFGALAKNAWEPTMRPTTASPATSPAPTLRPSPAPSVDPAAGASHVFEGSHRDTFYYRTLHAGKRCLTAPLGYIIESTPLNWCQAPNPGDYANMNQASLRYKFTCSAKGTDYSLSKSLYSDANCEVPTADKAIVYSRDKQCKHDSDSGLSTLTGCGPLAPALKTADQVVLESYANVGCTTARRLRSVFLGVCSPVFVPGKGTLAGHQKIVASTAVASDGAAISLAVQTFSAEDRCTGTALSSTNVAVSTQSTACSPDPLNDGLFYRRALRTSDLDSALLQAKTWIYIMPTALPTSAPTAPTA